MCRAGAGSGANPSGIADDAVTKAREKLNEGKARFGDLFKDKVNRAVWIPPNFDYMILTSSSSATSFSSTSSSSSSSSSSS